MSVADTAQGVSTVQANPLGFRLMSFFASRDRGVAVFKMSDGSYAMNRPVPGINVPSMEPYPATTPDRHAQLINGEMMDATSFYADQETDYPAVQPQVALIYNGGSSYEVSATEAAALTAAGFGPYIT